ncbi:unnamed protein product [Lupinus luteus]|uniref:Uncharacterized protein n=1 Tax=Lupinus luteus TaxID=3873 RepID=A0AAV1WMN5_LUPLU
MLTTWEGRKFREALATNPAFHGIKQYLYHREPRSVITPHDNNIKVNQERGGGAIPIMFDYTNTPRTTMSHIGIIISEREDKVGDDDKVVEPEPEPPRWKGQHDVGVKHSEQQVKRKSIDINDTFTEYIQRAKCRIRSVSNDGNGHNNSSLHHHPNATTTNNMEKNHNQHDQFSDFIQHAKNKLRTTSNIGNSTTTASFKRG